MTQQQQQQQQQQQLGSLRTSKQQQYNNNNMFFDSQRQLMNNDIDNDSFSYCSSSVESNDESEEERYFTKLFAKAVSVNDDNNDDNISSTENESISSSPDDDYDDNNITNDEDIEAVIMQWFVNDDDNDNYNNSDNGSSSALDESSNNEEELKPITKRNNYWDETDRAAIADEDNKNNNDDDYDDDYDYENDDPIVLQEVVTNKKPVSVLLQVDDKLLNSIPSNTGMIPNEIIIFDNNDTTIYDKNNNNNMIWEATLRLNYNDDIILNTYYEYSANQLYPLLLQHLHQPNNTYIQKCIIQCIQEYPLSCQIQYPSILCNNDNNDDDDEQQIEMLYPITYFCKTGCINAVRIAYEAFPEAIGFHNGTIGLPLHYACYYQPTNIQLIQYLLQKFPDGAKFVNTYRKTKLYKQQTPLHVLLSTPKIDENIDNKQDTEKFLINYENVVRLLIQHNINALQMNDCNGYTPIHLLCQMNTNNQSVAKRILPIFIKIQKNTYTTTPITPDYQKPLHIAASANADITVIELLLQYDIKQAKYTDDIFQTPLHKSVIAFNNDNNIDNDLGVMELLIMAFPGSLIVTDENHETPYDIAIRLHPHHKQLHQLLKP